MHNSVFTSFDIPSDLYAPDVRAIKDATIGRFGAEEWRTVVLTNEMHGHLGIYSTLGAKMGCLAVELLGEDEPQVLSFAGLTPPISCFNDGLQISTGSSVGHGLIKVSDEEEKRAEAVFALGEKCIRMRLKTEYQLVIRADIRKGTELYGRTASYWEYVRALALRYWSEWDRHEIFEIEHINANII